MSIQPARDRERAGLPVHPSLTALSSGAGCGCKLALLDGEIELARRGGPAGFGRGGTAGLSVAIPGFPVARCA